MQEDLNNTTFNTSSDAGEVESSSAGVEDSSEFDSPEESSEVYTEVGYDYTEQFNAIQSGLVDINTRLDLTITLLFISLAIFVSVLLFRIFNWFWKDL